MNDQEKRTWPPRRTAVKVAGAVSLLALALCLLWAYRWWRPADRVVVTVTHIDPSTRFLCLVADTPHGPEPMWWSLRKLGPFTMHPRGCTASLFDPEWDGTQTTRGVSWLDGTRYGVLTCDQDGRWWVFWFTPEEVHLRGRYWVVGGGEASIELPPKDRAEPAEGLSLGHADFGPEGRKRWGRVAACIRRATGPGEAPRRSLLEHVGTDGAKEALKEKVGAGAGGGEGVTGDAGRRKVTCLTEHAMFSEYDVLEELSPSVFKVRDRRLNRVMALKVLAGPGASDAERRRRFLFEARVMAALDHPGVVSLHEVGEAQDRPYLLLEFVEAGNLAGRLGTPWPARETAELVRGLADALHAVHGIGVVHRAVEPTHILLTKEGQPKVTGFGRATPLGQAEQGHVHGVPSYMAPEEAIGRGELVGPATDVYSLGAVLYELLAGRPPFRGATPLETLHQVVNDAPPPLRSIRPGLPSGLGEVCMKCLEKRTDFRYQTAKALADDLGSLLEGGRC
jgi:hypothetical protein